MQEKIKKDHRRGKNQWVIIAKKIKFNNGWCLDVEMYEVKNGEDPVDAFVRGIEKSVGSDIFTFKILERDKEGLLSVIVFEDRRVLYGYIKADSETTINKMGIRIQANFI